MRRLGASRSRLGGLLKPLGASWRPLGASWKPLGPSWRRLVSLLGLLGRVLEASWASLGGFLGRLGGPLGTSWGHLGGVLEPLGDEYPRKAKTLTFLDASWDHLDLIFGTLFDILLMNFQTYLILSLKTSACRKVKKYYFCNTGGPLHIFE